MTIRVCVEAGCPVLTRKTRCHDHERAKDKARGTRQERGYDADYDRERAAWQLRLDTGERVTCWRCTELGRWHDVNPASWHLGHSNEDRSIIRGPQCVWSNLSDAGRISPSA